MNRYRLTRLLCAALLTTLCLTPAFAGKGGRQSDDIEAINGHGRIDWTKGSLIATGLGAVSREEPNDAKAYLRARGFAKLDALRNLLMVIEHVHIDSRTTGADYEATSDVIRAEVEGIVRGAEVISERKIHVGRDTMVEVTVATRMYGDGGVASAFLPEEARREREVAPEPPREQPEVAPPAPAEPEIAPQEEHGARYTSVIIDTRGFKVERCMSPKIKRGDGSEVWGTVRVDPDYVIEHGIVIYAHSIAEARQLDRAGSNPLVIKATGEARTAIPSDAVVSDEDADRLLALNRRDGFLNRFNVIFVVDPLH